MLKQTEHPFASLRLNFKGKSMDWFRNYVVIFLTS